MSKQKENKTEKIKELESYFQTKNEHFNEYTFGIYKESIQKKVFEDQEIPLSFFNKQAQKLADLAEHPIQAIEQMNVDLERICENSDQRAFLLEWMKKYFSYTDFEKNTDQVEELISVEHKKYWIRETPDKKHSTENLRDKMKSIVLAEMEHLPKNLNMMLPKERIALLAKFMPYIFPKMEKVDYDTGD